jgi:hypothetical protein
MGEPETIIVTDRLPSSSSPFHGHFGFPLCERFPLYDFVCSRERSRGSTIWMRRGATIRILSILNRFDISLAIAPTIQNATYFSLDLF